MEDQLFSKNNVLFTFGPFVLDVAERTLHKNGQPVRLTRKVFDLLLILVSGAGTLQTRETLIDTLWPNSIVGEQSLATKMYALRKALGDNGKEPQYIETVRGIGYRFIAPVTQETAAVGKPQKKPVHRWRWRIAAAIGGAAAATAISLLILWPRLSETRHQPRATPPRPAVAILGFRNLSGNAKTAWIGTALAEMVSTDLAVGGQVRTTPAKDVARSSRELNLTLGDAKPSDAALRALRTNLDAGYVATGAYLTLGQGQSARLRVDMRLIDTSSGKTVVALSETGKPDELFSLVRSLGVGLRDHLGIAGLNATQESELRAAMPGSPDAARAYAEGLRALRQGDPINALAAFNRTVATEPNFPLAYVSLAQTWMALGDEVNAREAAEKALNNSAGLSRRQRLLIDGLYREASHKWKQAVQDYRALFMFYPDDLQYGLLLARAQIKDDKPADALVTIQALRKLPPPAGNDPRVDLVEADAADTLGDSKRARKAATQAVTEAQARGALLLQAQALSHIGRSEILLGDYTKALDHLHKARALYEKVGGDPAGRGKALEMLGNAYGAQGDYDTAIKLFREANKTFARIGNRFLQGASLNNIGNIYYRRNQLSEARRYFEMALPLFQDAHRSLTASYVLNNIAVIRSYQGDVLGAIKNYQTVLSIRLEAGAKTRAADTLYNLGLDYTISGDLHKARNALDQARAIFNKSGNEANLSFVLSALANVDTQEDKLPAARGLYQQALAIRKKKSMRNGIARSERDLAELTLLSGEPTEAGKLALSAAKAYRNEKAGTDEAHARAVLGLALLNEGHRQAARAELAKVEALYPHIQNVLEKLTLDMLRARIEAGLGNAGKASQALSGVRKKSEGLGLTMIALQARLALAQVRAGADTATAEEQSAIKQLITDARSAGYLLIAREAEKLLKHHKKTAAVVKRR